LRSAVSQVFNLPPAGCEQRSADYKSAMRRIKNLRYSKQIRGAVSDFGDQKNSMQLTGRSLSLSGC